MEKPLRLSSSLDFFLSLVEQKIIKVVSHVPVGPQTISILGPPKILTWLHTCVTDEEALLDRPISLSRLAAITLNRHRF